MLRPARILYPESVSGEPLNLKWYCNEISTYVSSVAVFAFILLEIQIQTFEFQ